MAISNSAPQDVRAIRLAYTIDDHIAFLHQQVTFSSSSDKEEVVLEACSLGERTHMPASNATYTFNFYFYLPTIREVGVRLLFSSFTVEVLPTPNVAPSQISLNGWSVIKAFEIICQ